MSNLVYHNINDLIVRLLTPNDTLDTFVFDTHQVMYAELRELLLNRAHYVFDKCCKYIHGLKVQDIYLTGSCADYFYHDKSDIDVCLNVINENCPYLTQDETQFNIFLTIMKFGIFGNQRFHVEKRSIDISFGMPNLKFMGLYSIMHNKWINKPHKDTRAVLNADEILEEYTKQFYQMKAYMREMQESGKLKTLAGIEELEKYYTDSVKTSNVSLQEYIIYKLLNYRGVHKELKLLFNNSLKDYLSFNGVTEDEGTVQPLIETSLSPAGFSYPQPLSYKLKP